MAASQSHSAHIDTSNSPYMLMDFLFRLSEEKIGPALSLVETPLVHGFI